MTTYSHTNFGSGDLADMTRDKQDEFIRILFSQDPHYFDWELINGMNKPQQCGLQRIAYTILSFMRGQYHYLEWEDDDDEAHLRNNERAIEAINLLAGTKLWLRLEEAFPPFDKDTEPAEYNWTEMEKFEDYEDLANDAHAIRELVEYLEKGPDPVDGVYFRLPFSEYKRGWNDGSLALYVDRGLATQVYQHAEPSWAHSLPFVFLAGLLAFIPVMIFVGFLWGLGVLGLAIVSRKVLSHKAVEWVRQDSLSSQKRYRWYSARKIVWAQKVQS